MCCCCLLFSPHNSHRGNLSGIWRQAGKHHLCASVNTQTHLSLVFTRLRTADTFGGKSVGHPMENSDIFLYSVPSVGDIFPFLFTNAISGDRDFNQANKIICLRQSCPGSKRNFEALPSYRIYRPVIFTASMGLTGNMPFDNLLLILRLCISCFSWQKRITFYFRESILHLRGISLN